MKTAELRNLEPDELNKELIASLKEQFNLRLQQATKQLVQNHNLKFVRRKIARIKTILHEKTG